jgi:hypothetical protein
MRTSVAGALLLLALAAGARAQNTTADAPSSASQCAYDGSAQKCDVSPAFIISNVTVSGRRRRSPGPVGTDSPQPGRAPRPSFRGGPRCSCIARGQPDGTHGRPWLAPSSPQSSPVPLKPPHTSPSRGLTTARRAPRPLPRARTCRCRCCARWRPTRCAASWPATQIAAPRPMLTAPGTPIRWVRPRQGSREDRASRRTHTTRGRTQRAHALPAWRLDGFAAAADGPAWAASPDASANA